ncbi:MAG: hypothetical protein LBM13_00020 [Candidatus Ancillula sp.]|jgi:hypothetical protein|nr:hypothetical protein [Candidatus Ancillula sp.]
MREVKNNNSIKRKVNPHSLIKSHIVFSLEDLITIPTHHIKAIGENNQSPEENEYKELKMPGLAENSEPILGTPAQYGIKIGVYIYEGMEDRHTFDSLAGFVRPEIYDELNNLKIIYSHNVARNSKVATPEIVRSRTYRINKCRCGLIIVFRQKGKITTYMLVFEQIKDRWVLVKFNLF